ncbi:arylsulfatase [Neolewinella aurantiaca]|uniref:Arylsulfatase n=1 Tax=Neolewinella aurantiaca TaxID=2602767 RepID=A0A5C7FMY2_9BACT|nr:arylsulfatase [Neolewinella aurantiaca]TXF86676.1 arylsulfatase [Neolewinella aurantiaca]
MRTYHLFCTAVVLIFTLLVSCSARPGKAVATVKPNIVYILADDLGYGDLGVYGQQKFPTPNIDALAAQGMLFTQHYSGSAVCAPARSSLMTGQHTGHTPIRGNKELPDREGQVPLPGEAITIAEVLKGAGYTTAAFGKWGLGYIGSEGDANAQGFDEFYGYNCQRMAHRYYPPHLWDNQNKVILPGNDWINTGTYAPDVIQEETLAFLEASKDQPFFAYVPLVLPHAELIEPNEEVMARFAGKFEETAWTEDQRYTSGYGPDMVPHEYTSQAMPRAAYAAMVVRMDEYVGEIMAKLEELGLAENTIVMFTSDNGPHEEGGADPAFFDSAGGLRGLKRDLYEGGIRAPFIVRWPAKVAAGSRSDHVSAFWDVMPTVADIAGVPTPKGSDGVSFLPTLTGEGQQPEHDYLYWEFPAKGGRKAVRTGDWKGVVYDLIKHPDGAIELYNLAKDPTESNNVADHHPDVVKKIRGIMAGAHQPSALFPFAK